MANRSDRELGHPAESPRRQSLQSRVGPSSRILSGPAVLETTASTGRTQDCTRPSRQNSNRALQRGSHPHRTFPTSPESPLGKLARSALCRRHELIIADVVEGNGTGREPPQARSPQADVPQHARNRTQSMPETGGMRTLDSHHISADGAGDASLRVFIQMTEPLGREGAQGRSMNGAS